MAVVAVTVFHGAGPGMGDDRAASLERLVRHDCGSCHGMTLKGGLGPALLASRLSDMASEYLAGVILDGIPGTPMPPWRGLLSEQDAIWIANYLKTEAK
jgi:cytochrome c55X